ncbi:MAG TPA: M48 family metallopeptidase [Acidimicrobiales bacterium]|nr:M48 family metallopeptidase [Acidimicrobiales bacterium]
MAVETARSYPGISAKSYEHPADRAATSALGSIPLLDRLLKRLSDLGLERRHRQLLLGNAVRVGSDQLPGVWELQVATAARLDISTPRLYVSQTPFVQGVTVGSHQPTVIVSSSLVDRFGNADLRTVLAHEAAHVLSEHVHYTDVVSLLRQVLNGFFPGRLLVGLPLRALYIVLLEWARAAELSCDRAAAVVLGDPLAACTTLMRMAGGPLEALDLQAFLRQATEYVEEDDLFSLRARFGMDLSQSHPFAVRRVKELVDWVSSGEYDRIVGGSYVRRGEEPPMSSHFEAAVEHYRARFVAMVDRTLGGVNRLASQIQDWLRTTGSRADADSDAEEDGAGGIPDEDG